MSVNIGYYRRIFGNFLATDNRVVTASDFGSYSITVPQDSRLPGAGRVMTGLYDVNPQFSGQSNNYISKADNFGTQTNRWNGVEINLTARLRQGLMLQGGSSTGRTTTDNCAIRAVLPEISPSNPYCHVEQPFLSQFKGLGSHMSESTCKSMRRFRVFPELAQRELQRALRHGCADAWPPSVWKLPVLDRQPGRAGDGPRGPHQPDRFPRREDPEVWEDAHAVQRRSLQRVEHERDSDLQPGVHLERGLADADGDHAGAVRQADGAA